MDSISISLPERASCKSAHSIGVALRAQEERIEHTRFCVHQFHRTNLVVAVISILSCAVCSAADNTHGADRMSSSISIASIDVNLVSMNREEVVEHQTVLVARD